MLLENYLIYKHFTNEGKNGECMRVQWYLHIYVGKARVLKVAARRRLEAVEMLFGGSYVVQTLFEN